MRTESKSSRSTKDDVEIYKIFFIPILLLLGVVPLITRLKVIELDELTEVVFKEAQVYDFFSQFKAGGIIALAGIALLILMLIIGWKEIKKSGMMWCYYGLVGIYLVMTALSTFNSKYYKIAMWGMADRAEGLVVLVAYVVIMLYTIYIVNKEEDYRYIIWPLAIVTVILGILGFYQYIGEDLLLQTEWGKKLIVPEVYAKVRDHMTSLYETGRIYGTLYHYNYMGSFTAMIIPLFLTLALFLKGIKKKIVLGALTVVGVLLLLGSTSRAGLIGLGCSLVMLLILFFRVIFKNYKAVIAGIIVCGCLIVGVNIATQGKIFERIPVLVSDAISMFKSNEVDYRDALPVRDIHIEDNTIVLQLQDNTLYIEATPYELLFRDEDGQDIEFVRGELKYTTTDSRFKEFGFSNQRVGEDATKDYVVITHNSTTLWVVEVNMPGAQLVDPDTLEPTTIEYPETIGFKGKEKLGSARGYIWSRSLPMLKDTVLLGYGPDTYALEFPQGDYFGKWYAYDTPYMIVDKPHNLYLQIGINQGGVALVAFVLMMVCYIIQSIRCYAWKKVYTTQEVMGGACTLAVIGYLGAGVFNDSVVSVAPIFWVLLGFGMATNYLVNHKVPVIIESNTEEDQSDKTILENTIEF